MAAIPTAASANPASTMRAGRRLPAFLPASMAMPNMDNDRGARQRPVCMALYSRVICRNSGRAIMAPPRVTFWSICWETPMRKFRCRNRSGSSRVGLPSALAPDEPVGEGGERDGADGHQEADELAALLPDEDAEHDAAHADDGQDGADQVDLARSGVGDVLDEADLGQDDGDDDDLEAEADPPRQEGRDEPAEERADGGGDGGGGADQGVGLLLGRPFEVAVDERLHRRQQQRRAEPADDGPEDDDRGEALGQGHGQGADRVGAQADHVGPSCGPSGHPSWS